MDRVYRVGVFELLVYSVYRVRQICRAYVFWV